MNSASNPPLLTEPELRRAAEGVSRAGESLPSFMEQTLRGEMPRRRLKREFVARGLASRDEARRVNEYFKAESVYAELRALLATTSGGKAGR